MKWFILFFLFFTRAYAANFVVSEVVVNCPSSERCEERKVRFQNLEGEYRSLVHLKDTLRIMASDGGYRWFAYEIFEVPKGLKIVIDLELKPLIKEVNVGFTDRNIEADPSQLVTIKEGEAFEIQKLQESMELMQKRLESLGYPDNRSEYQVKEAKGEVSINIVITLGEPRIFKGITSDSKSTFVAPYLERKFINLYNKPFDFNRFKLHLDDAQKELFSFGYYLINLEFTPVVKGHRVTLEIKVTNERPFAFDFRNFKQESRDVLYAIVTDLFRKYKRPLTDSVIRQALEEHYRNKALLTPQIEISTERYKNSYQEEVTLYRIEVQEGEKTRLVKVNFNGSTFYSPEKLNKWFDRDAFELASVGYYDEEYINYFVDDLRKRYVANGFVQIKVQGPFKTFAPDKSTAVVDYNIIEGPRAFVRSITVEGVPQQFEQVVLKEIDNKVGQGFNPLGLVEDIKKVSTYLQEHGYFYAEVTNANDEDAVIYNRSGTEVDINLKFNAGPVLKLNRVIILGNNKTRKRVIMKKIFLEEGDLITPSKVRDIESALSSTGLFNTVQVVPMRHKSKNAATDLIVRLSEREYGLVEFAPGFRSDIGLKLTGTVSYLNIGGRNISLTLQSQINRRLNYQAFDDRRQSEAKSFIEYLNQITMTMGDLFDSRVDYTAALTFQRKRFYSFDADIQRLSNTFTRYLNKRTSTSLRHQFEKIFQWDATKPKDNGSRIIGALTPSLTYDLRNSQVNPVKGAFFNLSCEFANPYFGSQKGTGSTVNYYKLISRNRFYIPMKHGTVAISMVGGVQENLSQQQVKDSSGNPVILPDQTDVNGQPVKQTEGNIPTIKVFRLTGMDIVRGFSDQEINRLNDGRDISDLTVQNAAFLALFKLEPRFFINDSFMSGVFFDAGRVMVDRFDMMDLRTSAGLTFKVLTPVGTLDFDYGFKLLRKEDSKGRLEDPGRFHVSIGFF
ncbi:MAG: POTRA domain-containing protein [Bacteriovoracaceae bacterium]